MITDPASAIKREVLQLIDLQIETLEQESSLDDSQLQDYQIRSERIRKLYRELDRIRRESAAFKFARSSQILNAAQRPESQVGIVELGRNNRCSMAVLNQ